MDETSHALRREVEVTRTHVGDTIAALERKLNPKYVLDQHPLYALGIAFGAGVLLGRSKADQGIAHALQPHSNGDGMRASTPGRALMSAPIDTRSGAHSHTHTRA